MASRRSTTSSLTKRHASASENFSKAVVPAGALKKRPALANITNQRPSATVSVPGSTKIAPCSSNIVTIKKVPSTSSNARPSALGAVLPSSCAGKHAISVIPGAASLPRSDAVIPSSGAIATSHDVEVSKNNSESSTSSMDESPSICDSIRSPDVEYMDSNDIEAVDLIEKKTSSMLSISEKLGTPAGSLCILELGEPGDQILCVDDNLDDPQLCATIACDIYKHLRAAEAKKRPATNFMETIQKDINAGMRGILVDWLVEVAEEYRLVPDTLYLTVNYIDRYLSGNPMDRQRLQLLGVACMMIAAKYEEICAPQVEEFCYITDNTYFKDEVLEMESCVLNYLKFEMTAPTTKCFLRRFIRAAQDVDELAAASTAKTPLLQLECLANYIAELSLLQYTMLRFAPSLIAASSIFLAKFILLPSKRPWSPTLAHYTLYKPHHLLDCVSALHGLVCNNETSSLPAVREKYSQHKYKFVAKKYCPPSIPQQYFMNIDN